MIPETMISKSIAILAYHKIGNAPGEWQTWSYVTADIFKNHLETLKRSGWKIISYQNFSEGLANPTMLPDKSLLISFDDGYRNNLTVALPILKEYNYNGVMFVPTNFVGGYNAFDADIFYEPKELMCTWEELILLENSGISIQSHGVNHVHLSDLSETELEKELVLSKTTLERKLRKTIDSISYPYGDWGKDFSLTEKHLLKAGFKSAFLYGGGAFKTNNYHPFQISRIAIGPDTDIKKELARY